MTNMQRVFKLPVIDSEPGGGPASAGAADDNYDAEETADDLIRMLQPGPEASSVSVQHIASMRSANSITNSISTNHDGPQRSGSSGSRGLREQARAVIAAARANLSTEALARSRKYSASFLDKVAPTSGVPIESGGSGTLGMQRAGNSQPLIMISPAVDSSDENTWLYTGPDAQQQQQQLQALHQQHLQNLRAHAERPLQHTGSSRRTDHREHLHIDSFLLDAQELADDVLVLDDAASTPTKAHQPPGSGSFMIYDYPAAAPGNYPLSALQQQHQMAAGAGPRRSIDKQLLTAAQSDNTPSR